MTLKQDPNAYRDEQGVVVRLDHSAVNSNYRRLTPTEVYSKRMQELHQSGDRENIWPFIYGPPVATLVSSLTSFVSTIYVRQFLCLYTAQHFWATIMPSVCFPMAANYALFEYAIKHRTLTTPPTDNCEVCLQLRGSSIQALCGSILPLFFASISGSVSALTTRSYPIPRLNDGKALWSMFKRFGKSFRLPGSIMLTANVAVGSLITNMMLHSNERLLEKNLNDLKK